VHFSLFHLFNRERLKSAGPPSLSWRAARPRAGAGGWPVAPAMDTSLVKFVDETCNSPYEAQRVCDALVRCGVADVRSLAAMTPASLEDGIRAQQLVDELWVSTHALRIHAAARAEVTRSKAPRRVPTSPMRGKAAAGATDSVEDAVKRMRLQ